MKQLVAIFAITALLASCSKTEKKQNEFVSADVPVYHGKAWSSLTLTPAGEPKELALVLNNDVLNTVRVGDDGHTHHDDMVIVPVPQKATETTPFKFIMLNWNPSGHEPDQVYTVPHFDMHFYTAPLSEVNNYLDPVKLDKDPAAGYVPANHIGVHPLPKMGKHWIDVTSPELSGAPFTQTFIYGSYNGDIVFYEPMITLDYLKNTNSFDRPLPQPAKFKNAGFYPTRMKIKKKASTTEIILDGFTYRQAS